MAWHHGISWLGLGLAHGVCQDKNCCTLRKPTVLGCWMLGPEALEDADAQAKGAELKLKLKIVPHLSGEGC